MNRNSFAPYHSTRRTPHDKPESAFGADAQVFCIGDCPPGNVRPAAAQATRSLTTWGAVWAGAELFGTGGALLGLEMGPGAAVTSGVGALMGGFVGLFASEWLARRIDLSN